MKKFLVYITTIIMVILLASCKSNDDYKLSCVAPSGAPAVSAAYLATTYKEDYDFTFGAEADALKSAIVSKSHDIIIAPINLGATLYNKSEDYVLAAVLTWGNLYLASQSEIDLKNVGDRNFISFGQNTINDAIVNYIFEKKNISFKETSYLAATAQTAAQLSNDDKAICLVAEPVLSVTKNQLKAANKEIYTISIQELYEEVSQNNSFPQAGCFVNKEAISKHKAVVNKFLARLEESAKMANDKRSEVSTMCKDLNIFANPSVLANAIPNSNIKYVKASQAKAAIEYVVEIKPQLFGGDKPKDSFYYE